jgi:Ca-activated chloride channel family protein
VRVNSNLPVLLLRITVFVAVVFAIAGTALQYSGSQVDADYVLAIDASASMLAEDLTPNRFEAAKASAMEFVDTLPAYASVGVMSFSGISFVHQPLTSDKSLVRIAIDNQNVISAGGTSVGDAVITSTNLLANSLKPRVVILLTDGKSNLGVSLDTAIAYANTYNVIVYTIGVGTEEGYFVELANASSTAGIDLEELQVLANSTGGTSYHPASRQELLEAYADIAASEKVKASLDLTFWLLAYILVVLVLEWVLINTRYRIIP